MSRSRGGKKEKEFIRLLENNILNFSISGERAILFNENDEEIITLIRPLNESLVNSWDMISPEPKRYFLLYFG